MAIMTDGKGKSLSVLSVSVVTPDRAFLTSKMERPIPAIRFFLILKSVKKAPTSMAPTAIGFI
ncbi:hypothetical protein ES703_96667 [subsurface metagenome]